MHSVRVARCVKHIMVALGANGDDVRRAVQSALLHDIGKLLLRDVDIDKAGPFDATEYELVQAHPTLGATLLAPVEVLAPLIPAVLHHHERWDGSGYPYGLAADAIPSLARVVAVADSYDAMTSDRPYRAALAHNVTVDELLLQSGRQFATEIVDAFVSGRRTVRHA
jgi:putative nucleotidyltransferase with HDIG domain